MNAFCFDPAECRECRTSKESLRAFLRIVTKCSSSLSASSSENPSSEEEEEDDETEDLFSVRATFAIPTVVCLRPAVNELGDLGKRVVVYVPLWSSSFTIEER